MSVLNTIQVETDVNLHQLMFALREMEHDELIQFIVDLDLAVAEYEFTEKLIKSLQESLEESEESPREAWKTWKGGECPVPKGVLVDVEYRNGKRNHGLRANMTERSPNDASRAFWRHDGMSNDIVAYRLCP